jgi:hypothetical protein
MNLTKIASFLLIKWCVGFSGSLNILLTLGGIKTSMNNLGARLIMKQSQQSSCKTSDKLASVLGVSHEK